MTIDLQKYDLEDEASRKIVLQQIDDRLAALSE
jgi:hypothetical protein